jgi:broad specificity phosphatase PhoE
MNRIYLVRHGENYANITKEFSYKLVDYDLTEKGKKQAQQTAEYFKFKNIDYIYSSPLKRAIQTAEYISKSLEKTYEVIEGFRELNVGDLEKSKPDKYSWDIYFKVTNDWYSGKKEARFPNGENYFTLYNRFIKGLEYVTQNKKDKNIIIVGHGGIFTACILDLCSIKDRNEFVNRQNHNCSISEIVFDKKRNRDVKLIRWADCSHLSGEAASLMNGLPYR